MAAAPPVTEVGLPLGYGGCAEDTAALFRAHIAAEEADRKRLLAEYDRILQELKGLGDASLPAAAFFPAGCSTQLEDAAGGVAGYGSGSAAAAEQHERFTLLGASSHHAPLAGAAVSHEGVVVLASWDGSVQLFDFPGWHDLGHIDTGGGYKPASQVFIAEAAVVAAAFMPNVRHYLGLAVGSAVQLWIQDRGAWGRNSVFEHGAPVGALDFHATQSLLATAGNDGLALIWDVESRRVLRTLAGDDGAELSGCRFPAESEFYQYIAATSGLDGAARIWDLRRATQVRKLEGKVGATCLDLHAATNVMAVGRVDGTVSTWDARTWRELQTLEMRPNAALGGGGHARCVSISPCGTFLAVGGLDGELLVFDLFRQCRPFSIPHHTDCVSAVCWGGAVDWAEVPNFLTAASLDGGWSCWAHGERVLSDEC